MERVFKARATDSRLNYLCQLVFPARSWRKDVVYWPCEIAAAFILLAYIWQIELETGHFQTRNNDIASPRLEGKMIKASLDRFDSATGEYGLCAPIPSSWAGDFYLLSPARQSTSLLNCEFGWICLCYAIKHFLYLIDCALLFPKKRSAVQDFITHINNCALWLLWAIFGWLHEGNQIHAGLYERLYTDLREGRKQAGMNSNLSSDYLAEKVKSFYDSTAGWPWLWVICVIVFVINLCLFILATVQKRSSAYSGQALSTLFFPTALFFFDLFLKGQWIKSNAAELTQTDSLRNLKITWDYFEARWVFWPVYLVAYLGLVFSLICIYRAITALSYSLLSAAKWILYAAFLIALFLWTLFMDITLYNIFVEWKTSLMATHIICIVIALALFVLSLMSRISEGEAFYFRHDHLSKWLPDPVPYAEGAHNSPNKLEINNA